MKLEHIISKTWKETWNARPPLALTFGPNSALFTIDHRGNLRTWQIKNKELKEKRQRSRILRHSNDINVSPDGKYIAVVGATDEWERGYVSIYQLQEDLSLRLFFIEELDYPINSVGFSPDNKHIATGPGKTGYLDIFHWEQGW